MNTSEGQTGNLSLETVNPKSSESPSALQIEDQITTSRENAKKLEDSAIEKEQER